jgi:hypothetical protein
VDVDTWTVVKRYDENSSPAIPLNRHFGESYPWDHCGDGQYHPVVGYPVGLTGQFQCISVICGESDSVITIYPHPSDPSCNVTGLTFPPGSTFTTHAFITSTFVEAAPEQDMGAPRRHRGGILYESPHRGLLLLPAGGSSFPYTQVVNETYAGGWPNGEGFNLMQGQLKVYPERDLLILSFGTGNYGGLKIYNISSGGLWRTFKNSIQGDFPLLGLQDICLIGGIIYGCDRPTQADYETERYLYKIDVNSEIIQKDPLKAVFGGGVPKVYSCRAIDTYRIIVSTYGYEWVCTT